MLIALVVHFCEGSYADCVADSSSDTSNCGNGCTGTSNCHNYTYNPSCGQCDGEGGCTPNVHTSVRTDQRMTLAIGMLAASPKSKVQSPKLAEENSDSSSRSFLRFLRSFAVRLFGERSRPGCRSTRLAPNTGDANDGASLATRGARVNILLFISAGMMAVGLVFKLQPGRMGGNRNWVAVSGQRPWQIEMAVGVAGHFGGGSGGLFVLAFHVGCRPVVSQASWI